MNSIQHLKKAAAKLKAGKLNRLDGKEISESLKGIMESLGLETKEEAIIFTAIFDRSCSGRSSDLEDIADYFDSPQLDIMEYVPALRQLQARGLVMLSNRSECRLVRQNFLVTNYVVGCILDNKKPDLGSQKSREKEFDAYDLCKQIGEQVEDDDVAIELLLQFVETLESENESMPLVKMLKQMIPGLAERTLFYDICKDYIERDGNGRTGIVSTMRDMYQSFGQRLRERKSLLDGNHPLLSAGLIELTGDKEELRLTVAGQKLFLGADFGAFTPEYNGLNIYSFARKVKEFVHSDEHDVDNAKSMERLAEKIRCIEESNSGMESISKVKSIVSEEDLRALFYMAADACANADDLSLSRELGRLYPLKQRNQAIKEFKEEVHKLQRLDLMEMVSQSSIFGEYNVIQLTDKGKELYFGEDASLFIEKTDKKNLIAAGEIKEKHLFFSPEEQEQLQTVGNSLIEENYRTLTSRLEEKGLPKGMAILLYGAPGTGKTESVMQWARNTGRDIIHVDISASKSMWYGESEKIIKEIFINYRRQCRRSALTPILLFNEADAIFSTRKSSGHNSSLDQTENAIQNIILEEMERLEGILIATTNLADNLDKAFERRFLFKIRFNRPSTEAKMRIWRDKLPLLSDEEALRLAADYDFSGGEIDNIARKALMAEILEGRQPDVLQINRLCTQEKIGSPSPKVGFHL